MENNEQLSLRACDGDMAARNLLLENNLPFIQQTANDIKKQYSDGRIDVDDMIQEGCLGLMEAVRHFDTSRGTKFLSYAVFWIRKFMREAANDLTASAETISLDAIVDDEGHTELSNLLSDSYIKTPEQIVIEAETREEVHIGLRHISARNRTYLLYRYGFTDGDEHSITETAAHFTLTEKRAKSTEQAALTALRRRLLS